ncbi:Cytochrome P450, partial [Penicillium concentricum]
RRSKERNHAHARRIGPPFLVYPVLTSIPLRAWLRRSLPTRIWNRLMLVIYGWEFHEKRRPFDEYAAPQGDDRSSLRRFCNIRAKQPKVVTKSVIEAAVCHTTGMLDELLLAASEKERGFAESNELLDMTKRVIIHML